MVSDLGAGTSARIVSFVTRPQQCSCSKEYISGLLSSTRFLCCVSGLSRRSSNYCILQFCCRSTDIENKFVRQLAFAKLSLTGLALFCLLTGPEATLAVLVCIITRLEIVAAATNANWVRALAKRFMAYPF